MGNCVVYYISQSLEKMAIYIPKIYLKYRTVLLIYQLKSD